MARSSREAASVAGAKQDAVVANNDQAVEWLGCALSLDEGQTPFPWQVDLLRRFLREEVISALDIPTGLGKTATMAVWLVARAHGAPLPRRLVYVVDRQAVVDQATEVAEALRAWVNAERPVADALGLGDRPLPISTLRGQHVDNREWLEDPSSPAIVVGTVDMVGSRLLFSGYGVSSKMRPYHAGLLGADALVVLDEAHLVPAFEDLLRRIEGGADMFGPRDPALRAVIPRFVLLSLSATGRQTGSTSLTFTDEDRKHRDFDKRLTAEKSLATVELDAIQEANDGIDANGDREAVSEKAEEGKKSKAPQLASELAKQAWHLTNQGSAPVRCLVFCDARKDAIAVDRDLRGLARSASAPEPKVELFVGARRVRERIQAREALAELGFLAGKSVKRERAVFLVATSAGEVGVDLDADHMVCDLVAWERMVQRLGRVNRRGNGNAKVVVVLGREPVPSGKTAAALERRDASKAANEQLEELKRKLSPLQSEKKAAPGRRKRTSDENAVEEKRKQAEKDLKKSISACRKRIRAFKDADAKMVSRHEAEVAKNRALRELLGAVGEGGSLSPEALLELRQRQDLADALRDATTIEPIRPDLTRALVDAWSMTSLDEHPGRPEVDPWLRGFRPNDPPQTTLVWRRHLPVRHNGSFDAKAAKRFFEAAPPHTSEQLETETHLVVDWLIERAGDVSNAEGEDGLPTPKQVVAIALTSRGEVKAWRTLEQLADGKSKGKKGNESKEAKRAREQLEELLTGTTFVVDARLGGLKDGLLDGKAKAIAEAADDATTTWLTRPETAHVPVTGFRVRQLRTGEDDGDAAWRTAPGSGWVRRYLFVTEDVDGEPAAALVIDGWALDSATEDERAEADRPQQLDEHERWAEEAAREVARRFGLDKKYEDILALAARLHDEGKRALRWQRAFKAPADGRPYAKTKGPIDFDILDGYRHELGSLAYVEAHDEFKKLSVDDQDDEELVLHLVAAHHGYARPVIGTRGCDDAPPSIVDERARAVALRFARLSRRWGPWGLAWWEALLRAADQAASRRNQQRGASATLQEQS